MNRETTKKTPSFRFTFVSTLGEDVGFLLLEKELSRNIKNYRPVFRSFLLLLFRVIPVRKSNILRELPVGRAY